MKTMRLFKILFILQVLVFTGLACMDQGEEETTEIPPVQVVTARPEIGTITDWFKTSCELRSPLETHVSFPNGGRIIELTVDEGDIVTTGMYLGRVDTSTMQAQLAAIESQVNSALRQAEAADLAAEAAETSVGQAKAVYEQMQRDYERIKALREENVATQAEFEQIELQLETSKLNLEAAKDGADASRAQAVAAHSSVEAVRDQKAQIAEMIDDGTLRAPFRGRVASKMAEPGTVVGPGTPIFRIVGEGDSVGNRLEVVYDLPEVVINRIETGLSVDIDLLSCDRIIEATIDHMGPEVIEDSRTVEVISYIPMDSMCLLPGMFGTVHIPLETRENAILVPVDSILVFEDVKIAFVAEGDKAVKRQVETGLREEGKVEVLEGITADDELIVVGNSFLSDGAGIEVRSAEEMQMNGENTDSEGE